MTRIAGLCNEWRLGISSAALFLLLGFPGAGLADDPLLSLRSLEAGVVAAIERAEPSVVSISVHPQLPPGEDQGRGVPAARSLPSNAPTEFGSGVILAREDGSEERFVLTAAHVLFRPAPRDRLPAPSTYLVRLASRHVVACDVVAADPRSDLAVLRLPLGANGIPVEDAPPIELGDATGIRKGAFVIALGNPYAIARDGSASASVGIVSNLSRKPWPPGGGFLDPTETNLTIHHYGTLLHIDTRLNLGTSGGAVVDLSGRLIGLSTSLAALEGYESSVGYAVPVDGPMRRIVASLMDGYEVEYGFLGVQPGDADAAMLREHRRLTSQATAAIVRRIVPGSPADLAGLKSNDIVLAVEGMPVYSEVDLVREVGWIGPDVVAELTVLRPGEERLLTLPCRLAKWPVYDDSLLIVTRQRHPGWRGLNVDYPTARRRFLPGNVLERFPKGVVITRVDPGTPAAAAGLRPELFITHVGRRSVTTPEEFTRAVADLTGDVSLQLTDGRTIRVPGE